MVRYSYVLVCFLLVLSNLDLTICRHSYPKSRGGLSGGGRHSYPPSTGLSGGGHGYPSSGVNRGYPSSGGSHTYPSSGGSHAYPPNTNTGSHGYPGSRGLSGNSPSQTGHATQTTNVHYHYNYNPPQQIRYTPAHGGPPVSYPVYRGSPPTYVYQYKDSGSKYGTLLAGLALLNLGTLGVSAYALSKSGGQSSSNYKPQPGEYCKFGIKKNNGDYEETKIDCNLITSFIFEADSKPQSSGTNSTVVTVTTTNVTIVNSTNGGTEAPAAATNGTKILYEMLPNGTLVPVSVPVVNTTEHTNNTSPDGTMISSVTSITTTNSTTVSNALDVKGDPIKVTPGMQCYVIRHSPTSNMKKAVSCDLLQKYADESLKKNSASRNVPVISILSVVLAIIVAY